MIVTANESSFDRHWTQLTNTNYCKTWPLYSKSIQRYYEQNVLDNGYKSEDISFIFLIQNKPVFGFRGALIEANDGLKFIANQIPCVSIELKNHIKAQTRKKILSHFESIINLDEGKVYYLDFLPEGVLSTLGRHLLKLGAVSNPVFGQTIDLTQEVNILKQGIRKGYTSLVNWGLNELQIEIKDYSNITSNSIEQFRQLHIRESGRETRSKYSWERQLEVVLQKEGFVIFGKWNDELVAAGYFFMNKQTCFYGSSASRRDLFNKPLFHALLWRAILYSKDIGCSRFDLGAQFFPAANPARPVTDKEIGITTFKSGFGGTTNVYLELRYELSSH